MPADLNPLDQVVRIVNHQPHPATTTLLRREAHHDFLAWPGDCLSRSRSTDLLARGVFQGRHHFLINDLASSALASFQANYASCVKML